MASVCYVGPKYSPDICSLNPCVFCFDCPTFPHSLLVVVLNVADLSFENELYQLSKCHFVSHAVHCRVFKWGRLFSYLTHIFYVATFCSEFIHCLYRQQILFCYCPACCAPKCSLNPCMLQAWVSLLWPGIWFLRLCTFHVLCILAFLSKVFPFLGQFTASVWGLVFPYYFYCWFWLLSWCGCTMCVCRP